MTTTTTTSKYETAVERLLAAGEVETALRVARAHATRVSWVVACDGVEVEYDTDDADDAAREYVDGGWWGDHEQTHWVHVQAWRRYRVGDVEVDEDNRTVTVTVEPEEPPCAEGYEHEWISPHWLVGGCETNPGVWGHGGGVVLTRACRHCGCRRDVDTWAQDPETGVQGLTSTRYVEGEYAEALYERGREYVEEHEWDDEGECVDLRDRGLRFRAGAVAAWEAAGYEVQMAPDGTGTIDRA